MAKMGRVSEREGGRRGSMFAKRCWVHVYTCSSLEVNSHNHLCFIHLLSLKDISLAFSIPGYNVLFHFWGQDLPHSRHMTSMGSLLASHPSLLFISLSILLVSKMLNIKMKVFHTHLLSHKHFLHIGGSLCLVPVRQRFAFGEVF